MDDWGPECLSRCSVVSFLEILKIIFSDLILPPTVYRSWTYLAFFRGRLIITWLLSPWVSWDGISDSLLFKTTGFEPAANRTSVLMVPYWGWVRRRSVVWSGGELPLLSEAGDRPVSPAEAGWSVCTLHYCDILLNIWFVCVRLHRSLFTCS